MLRILFFAVCVFITGVSKAQDVTFVAQGPGMVESGERFRLTYTINSQPSNFEAPQLDNFYIIAGPSTSTNTSIEVVNGKMTRSHSITYTYVLEAVKEGKFTIPSAKAKVDRKTYESNPVEIEVIKPQNTSAQQGGGQNTQGANVRNTQQAGASNIPDEDLFVTIDFNKHSAYLGEPIEATLKLFTRVDIAGFEDAKFPTFAGLWSQELQTSNNITFQRANVNGKIYNVGIIRKYLLFPQKSDRLEIEPFELGVIYNAPSSRPRSIFDDFFGAVEQRRKKLVSRPVSVSIKPLPPNAPASFTGAVGSFKMTTTADKTELKANEAVTLKIAISGSGNMKLFGTPKVEFPAGFELFDPKTSDNTNTQSGNVTGSKSYEYIAIPRTSGVYQIPEVKFTYFDISKESYVTLSSQPFTLNVATDSSARNVVVSGYSKEDVKFIGQDIRFIKTNGTKLKPMSSFVVKGGMYRLMYLLAAVAFIAFMIFYGKHRTQMSDINIVRNRRANKAAQKRLKAANAMLSANSSEKFYEEINHAVMGYAADKLNIPLASLSLDNVKEKLMEHKVDNADIEEFKSIVDTCEYARFSPMAEHSQMDTLYSQAYRLISKLEQVLK